MNIKIASPHLVKATLKDYNLIQNLARFYVYDMSRYCGFISEDWACPPDGLYESFDYKSYLTNKNKYAFIVKIGGEIAGFVLIKKTSEEKNSYRIAEFFIVAKFQGYGV